MGHGARPLKFMSRKTVILLSGGMDSATSLAIALNQKYECYALSFDYSQRHAAELIAARKIAETYKLPEHKIFTLDHTLFGDSALTNLSIDVPETESDKIPVTYVPGRNMIFLSIAAAWAETLGITDIFIGVNAIDYSGYPDCRPEFIKAFNEMANLATKFSVEGNEFIIHTPLINLSKPEIIQIGHKLDLDYSNTVSCYQSDKEGRACKKCDACRYRRQGFLDAGLEDVTKYA